ncbi:MAG: hypothetical protein WD469_14190 [Paenibacillaceae bacterium]
MDELKETVKKGSDNETPLPVQPTAVGSSSIPLVAVPVLRDEEYATELAEPMKHDAQSDGDAEPISRIWGWSAMVVSILSLFIFPIIMGSAGSILGIIAVFKGTRMLGGWSIAIGLVSIFTALILVPYYA